MKEYIEKHGLLLRIALIEHNPAKIQLTNEERMKFVKLIEEQPTADVIERSAYNQVAWERDTAIAQLASIGKGFGEKMDDVVVRKRGKWIIKDNPGTGWYRVTCSECGEDVTSAIPVIGFFPNAKPIWNFCPDCGSDNREENDNG